MGDYIRHQSALDAIEAERKVVHHESQRECTEEACHDEYVIARVLERLAIRVQIIPSADVRPVVRGRWIKTPSEIGTMDVERCSVCGCEMNGRNQFWDAPFCPRCGAEMNQG